jgi:thiol-disulfide isomerase/thioredoxin
MKNTTIIVFILSFFLLMNSYAQAIKVVEKKEEREAAANFKLEDFSGNIISLNSLKGKVIYLDIWATWCMPCRAQFPKAEELKIYFEGKDVAFVYVSTDTDKNKWKKFVNDKKLNGIHLFADNNFNTEYSKKYGIKGIPRFMLFDKWGNIYSYDALRPGQFGIEEEIEKLLAEN